MHTICTQALSYPSGVCTSVPLYLSLSLRTIAFTYHASWTDIQMQSVTDSTNGNRLTQIITMYTVAEVAVPPDLREFFLLYSCLALLLTIVLYKSIAKVLSLLSPRRPRPIFSIRRYKPQVKFYQCPSR